jgi:hypothetical protein
MTAELLGMKAVFNAPWPDRVQEWNTCQVHQSREFREDNEKGFRPCVKAIADLTNVNAAVVAQEKLLVMLRDMGEERAADWIEDEWTSPKEGQYPLAFS